MKKKRALIGKDETIDISMSRQAHLLDISRGSLYYVPTCHGEDDRTKGLIDRIYTDCPFYGSRRMRVELSQSHGVQIGRDHVRRLMAEMGIEAIYPKKNED